MTYRLACKSLHGPSGCKPLHVLKFKYCGLTQKAIDEVSCPLYPDSMPGSHETCTGSVYFAQGTAEFPDQPLLKELFRMQDLLDMGPGIGSMCAAMCHSIPRSSGSSSNALGVAPGAADVFQRCADLYQVTRS